MDSEFVGEIAASARRADGIDVADNVGHGHVGSGKFFNEAVLARHPGDGSVVALRGDFFAAGAANGFQRIVVDFAASNNGHFRIEKINEPAKNAALGLAAKPQKNKIVAREQGIHNLRHDGVFVAVHARKKCLTFFDGTEQVATDLVLYRTRRAARVKIGDAF